MRIKRLLVFIIPVFITVNLYCEKSPGTEPRVTWYDYETGIKLAKKEQKPLIVDFYASWCHWCRVMEKETFMNETVAGKLKKKYIPVRVDIESNRSIRFMGKKISPKELAALYGVRGLPAVAFLNKQGELVTLIPGFVKVDTFLPLLNYMEEECYNRQITFKDYVENNSSCEKK